MGKPKIGMYWCASCGGCEEAVVDLAEDLLMVTDKVDIVFWPVAMDFKLSDVEAMEDGEMLAVFINGAIELSEQEEIAKLLRRKAQLVIAFGSCAHMGGLPGLANMQSKEKIFDYYFHSGPIVDDTGVQPDPEITKNEHGFALPEFYSSVRALDQVINVDYYVPGCAPTPNIVLDAITTLLSGNLPPSGAIMASDRALCYECPLNETKPDEGMKIKELRRSHEVEHIDSEICLLTQGMVCLGPVTRGGCGSLCIKGNMPCTGCFGPMDGVKDFGATALSYIASIIDSENPEEIEKIIDKGIPDPIGTFYMYSLPKSMLFKKLQEKKEVVEIKTE